MLGEFGLPGPRRNFCQSVLSSLNAHIAVLDQEGIIVAVNDAWRQFAVDNGDPSESAVGVGADYLGACRQAAAEGDEIAGQVLEGILAVKSGQQPRFSLEYPCHSPDQARWFLMSVTRLSGGSDGVVVSHEDITARRLAEDALRNSHELLEQRVNERTAELQQANAALREEIFQRLEAESKLHRLAHHDPLTGLPNRLLFFSQLKMAIERAQRHGRRFALLFLDLDRFKIINDTLGHAVGDKLLQSAASRLTTMVRREDMVARWGGDEFVILVEEVANARDAALLAGKLVVALAEPAQIGNDDVDASVSIGISIYPDDAETEEDLIKMADAAMYHAKECGRHNYQFYRAKLAAKRQKSRPNLKD